MKKQNKWLDNYGKVDNANESNVTLPEGFVGMGYDTSGRKNSPAWGGQFQTGGSIPGTPGFTYARTINPAPSEGKYAKKTLPSAQNGIQQDATRVNNNVSDKLWGIQRELDAQKLSDDSFREKYGMPLHQFKMRDAEYASAFQRQMEQRRMSDPNYAELNLPQTDVRSRIYQGNPNLGFIPGTSKGESRSAMEDLFLATTTATAPLLPINTAKIAKGAQQLGKYLTEETALRNAYKLNPYAFKPQEGMMYRGIGKEGMEDALQSGVFRPKNAANTKKEFVTESGEVFNFGKSFDKTYYSPDFEIADRYGKGYIGEVPNTSAVFNRRYANKDWSYHTNRQIPIQEGKLLQKDWLRGYKPIEVPKSSQTFKSEIDWAKWNKEIPENKALMQEYNAIEQEAKATGTWMKNPDGSAFQGTPEQFVQQNSQNFKKSFPNVLRDRTGNVQKTYHGSQDKFESFDPSIMRVGRTRGQGIYTSPIKERAASYADKGEKQLYEFYQNANKKQTIVEDFNALSQKRFDKFLKENPKGSEGFDEKFKAFMDEEDIIFNRDLSDDAFNLNKGYDFYKASPDEYVVPFTNYPKSAIGNNGMFDMTNPNIYKGIVPAGIATALSIDQKRNGGKVNTAQNGQEMKFYQNGLDWKPKSMQDGGQQPLRVSTTDPEYRKLYENRQVGRWLDENTFDSQVPLDEVTVRPQSYSMESLRDFTKAAMYGVPENLMKLEQVPTAALTETVQMLRGEPYDFRNVNPNFGQFGSNQRDLSVLGYENPEGFMQNAVNMGLSAIDPAMVTGLAKNPVKNLTKTFTDNLNYSKSINPQRNIVGDELKPAFGFARGNETFVRGDLPERVKNFVQAHEDYHVYDFQKYPNASNSFLRRELPANFFPALKDPLGFAATVKQSMNPERLKFYSNRILGSNSESNNKIKSGLDNDQSKLILGLDNLIPINNVVNPTTAKAWQMEELPGLHLKSTMEGEAISKIVEPKTGLINTEQALAIIGKESGGSDKVALIRQGLGDNIPKKMDFNEFRKITQDQLIPLEKQFVDYRSDYGIHRLGYKEPEFITRNIDGKTVHEMTSDVIENQTMILENKSKFGKGSSAHSNPEETLGHAHFLRDVETPDVLTVTQIQSDAFQGKHKINIESEIDELKKLEEYNAGIKPFSERKYITPDGEFMANSVYDRYIKEQSTKIKENLKSITQKQLLNKNHQERYLQELVDYAGKRGDLNKVRVPTSETAAKVQGYSKNTATGMDEMGLPTELGYSPEHQTILKKYSEQPKTIKKLFGKEPTIVTDNKGNTWYEFDIPDKFKKGKGEIKAFSTIGTAGAAGIAATQLDKKKYGGIVEDDMGYWNPDNHGKAVRINSNNITMEGVYEPLLGIDDTGDTKLMLPGENYKFKGKKVTEYPLVAEDGGKFMNQYTINQGDTLSKISKETGYSVEQLAKLNNIEDPNKIYAGQKLTIPYKFDKSLSIKEIPQEHHKNIVIDDYSKSFNYIVQGDKVYYAKKNSDNWVDISDNKKAKGNLYTHIDDKYGMKGYSDYEKNIRKSIADSAYNYDKSYNQRYSAAPANYVEAPKKSPESLELKGVSINSFNNSFKQPKALPVVNDPFGRLSRMVPNYQAEEESNPIVDYLSDVYNKASDFATDVKEGVSEYIDLGANWLDRQYNKQSDAREESSYIKEPIITNSEYSINQPIITGDTLRIDEDRYYLPEVMDLNEFTFKNRNRNELTPIETEAASITAFNPFQEYDAVKKLNYPKDANFIGVNPEGNFKSGSLDQFDPTDKLSRVFKNNVESFVTDKNNELKFVRWNDNTIIDGKRVGNKDNPNSYVPLVNVIGDDGKKSVGSLNLLVKSPKETGTFGQITGGRLIFKQGDKQILVSGSVKDIKSQFDKLSKNGPVEVFTLDNGSYSRGLRTYDKKISPQQLQEYDRQNVSGGHFLYSTGQKTFSKYPEERFQTPNIRTEQDESYKQGHPLKNELQGVVLHQTAYSEKDLSKVHEQFMTPNKNSAHVLIGYDGERRVYADPEQVTFHGGVSSFKGRENVNDFMLGLEFQGVAGKHKLTDKQIESAVEYLTPIIRKYNIPIEHITSHAAVAPGRKHDVSDDDLEKIYKIIQDRLYTKKRNGGTVGINQLDAQPKKKLNQLLNFTNNPDKNWLDKYQ